MQTASVGQERLFWYCNGLKDITGALGATIDEGSWISTGYLVAEIIVIPMTGWLAQVFSVRRL